MKFDVEKIVTNERNYDVATRYVEHQCVEYIYVKETEHHQYAVEAEVNVYHRLYDCSFIYDANGNVTDNNCECAWNEDGSPCGHIGAVLFIMNTLDIKSFPFEYISSIRLEQEKREQEFEMQTRIFELRSMQENSARFLNKQRISYNNQIDHLMKQEQYDITPSFGHDYNGYFVTYKVGNSKKYIIRNIEEFLRYFENNDAVRYGKFLTIVHKENSFTEFANHQINFMRKVMPNQVKLKEDYRYYYMKQDLERNLYLTGKTIDDFYDAYQDYDLDGVYFSEEYKPMLLKMVEYNDYYIFQLQDDNYTIGKKYLYDVEKENDILFIKRIVTDESGRCVQFLKEFINDSFVIEKSQYEAFYKYILAPIKDCFILEGLKNIDDNHYDTIKIYGDIDDDSRVIFKIYYENENQDRILAFQKNLVTNYNQDIVEKYFYENGQVDEEKHCVYFEMNSSKIYELIQEGLDFLAQYAQIYVSEALKQIGKTTHYTINVGVKIQNNLLSLDIDSLEIPKIEIASVLEQYKRKKKFYRLKSGELLSLNSPELEELAKITDEYHIQSKDIKKGVIQMNRNRAFSIEKDISQYEHIHMDRKKSFQDLIDKFNQEADDVHKLSPYYQNTLRDYQKQGVAWLKTLYHYGFNGILADDMGLGKTLQVIALLDELYLKRPSIVVCPSSLIYNWEDEVHKFAPHLNVKCIVGPQRARQEIIASYNDYRLLITSYDYLKRDIDLYKDNKFSYIVLDESQYIKNQKTKSAQSVKQLNGQYKLALSGTPIENSLAELWSVFDFLMPQYLYNYHYFQKEYESAIVKNQDAKAIAKLQKLVYPFILRRNKKDVLKELPDKIETTQLIPFTSKESELYYANLAQVNEELQALLNAKVVDRIQILAMLTRLRQICCEPRMIYENIDVASSKLKACLDLLKTYQQNQQKVLLFSTFTKVFDLLEEELRLNGISYLKITGSTSKEKRKEYVERFQNGEADVFLISLKAGGTGLNLTKAEAVIHFDPWWNVSAQNQATDRAYRIGQHNNVQVHRLIMKDSIEEKILKLQEKKKELADMFVENSTGSIASLSKEDIMDLFA